MPRSFSDRNEELSSVLRTRVSGAIGSAAVTTSKNPAGIAFSVAPAVEYNFSGSVGLIVGVQFSVAGRYTGSYVAPQIALSASF